MEKEGHEVIAHVGEKVLRGALARGNPSKAGMCIDAFYLGNWLTDVAQAVDPVLYKKVGDAINAYMAGQEALFKRMYDDAPSWIVAPEYRLALAALRAAIEAAAREVEAAVQAVFLAGKDGKLADYFRNMFYTKGYAKFVRQAGPTDMDP